MKICEVCKEELTVVKGNRCYYCNIRLRRTRVKLAAVKYKGGVCVRCKWVGPVEGFTFHHRDPDQKEFSISDRGTMYSWERIKSELDKCDLLCANCHNIDDGRRSEEFNTLVLDYKGDLDIDLPKIYLRLRAYSSGG